jgi:hypothetical protein
MLAANIVQQDLDFQRYQWLKRNRGALVRVSKELGVHLSVASRVFNGLARSARVEAKLRELHAPGFSASVVDKTPDMAEGEDS